MYRLIIVDDEDIIRQGLAKHIDWNSIGFEIVGQFEDGKDAIEYLQEHSVDAIFTDVQMYQVSGIELAKYVKEHFPKIKVVELSNYREFKYIKESLRFDVCDYVLKPVNTDEVTTVFRRVYEILKKNQKSDLDTSFPFTFYESEEYRDILKSNEDLADCVISASISDIHNKYDRWFANIKALPSQALFYVVSNFFESVYQRFLQLGIRPSGELSRNVVLGKLDGLAEKQLFDQVKQILFDFCTFMLDRKEMSKQNSIEHAQKYIRQHFCEKITVDDVAQNAFLNRSYLSREFKRQTGENVVDFILKCRMEKAIQYIKDGKYTVEAISSKIGYENVRYFHKVFKQYTGYTVKEYQKIMKWSELK